MGRRIIIGTRGSKLALWQAEWVASALSMRHPELVIEINKIKTTGDKILDVPLAKVGGKGLFVKEIEESLLAGKSDIAVHSMKDVPSDMPEGLHLKVICKREDPRDALVAPKSDSSSGRANIKTLRDLPERARLGTSSLRRACQIMRLRPDIKIQHLRGNLDTRLRKLDEGQYDAIILASAGLKRLGWANRITEYIDTQDILPAVGQGAIGIESRTSDDFINNLITTLDDPQTSVCVRAERAFLKKLQGGCQVPIAAHARLDGQSCLIIEGLVGSIRGDRVIRDNIEGSADMPESLGISLAERLLLKGAGDILKEVYEQ